MPKGFARRPKIWRIKQVYAAPSLGNRARKGVSEALGNPTPVECLAAKSDFSAIGRHSEREGYNAG